MKKVNFSKDIIKDDAPEQAGVKNKKRRSKAALSAYYTLIFMLVAGVGVFLSLTVLFKTDKIVVVGETPYNEADIIEASGIVLGENIIRASFKDEAQRIPNTLLYVETAEITKKFPTTIVITVTQTKACYNVETDGEYLIVSQSGKVLDKLVSPVDGLLTVNGINPADTNPFARLEDSETDKAEILFSLKKAIDKTEIGGIASVDLSDKYNISLNYEDRIEVQIGNSNNIDYKIEYAKSVFESNKIGTNADGYLIIDDNGEGHFVSRESMEEYKENSQNGIDDYNNADDDENISENTDETAGEDSEESAE